MFPLPPFPKSPPGEWNLLFSSGLAPHVYPLSSVVEHFLPGGVELTAVLLQQPLLGQGDGLLGCPQDLHGTLELLRGLLGLDLSLRIRSTVNVKAGSQRSTLENKQ